MVLFSKAKVERDLQLLLQNLQPSEEHGEDSLDLQGLTESDHDGEQAYLKSILSNGSDEEESLVCKEKMLERRRPERAGSIRLKIKDNFSYFFGAKHEKEAPPEVDNNEISTEEDELEVPEVDFPIGRAAITDPNQRAVFMMQIEDIRRQNEYFYYYKWVLWEQSKRVNTTNGSSSGGTLSAEKIIETNLDLKVAAKYFKKKLNDEDGTLIFMKLGIIPNKKTPKLINSSKITFQVQNKLSYQMLKETLEIVLNDELTSPLVLNSFTIHICGVSHRRTGSYSVLSLWLHQTPDPLHSAIALTETLASFLSPELKDVVTSGILVSNRDLEIQPIYPYAQVKPSAPKCLLDSQRNGCNL